jgi:ABC-type lipoprotein release transport system permease subunit
LAERHRTVYMTSALALSSCLLVLGSSTVGTLHTGIERGLRAGLTCDLQLFHRDNPPLEVTSEVPSGFLPVPDPRSTIELVGRDPEVVGVARRALASGILSTDGATSPALVVGVEPDSNVPAHPLGRSPGSSASIEWAHSLVGAAIAERMRIDRGDEVTLLIPTPDGLLDGDVFDVADIYGPAGLPLIDELVVFVRYDHLERMLGGENAPSALLVRLADGADVERARERLSRALHDAGRPIAVRTWEEMAGDLLGIVRVGRYFAVTGFVLLLVIVVIGIANMQLILVLEKIPQIGLMRALGTPSTGVLRGLLVEASLVSVAAAFLGTAAGATICVILGRVGIPAVSHAMALAIGGDRLFLDVRALDVALGLVVVALVGPLTALLPALRYSNVSPATVLRRAA